MIVLTATQKQCIDFAINAQPSCRYVPKNKNSAKFRVWKLVVSTPFESFIMVMIAMNTIILMMKVLSLLYRYQYSSTCCSYLLCVLCQSFHLIRSLFIVIFASCCNYISIIIRIVYSLTVT